MLFATKILTYLEMTVICIFRSIGYVLKSGLMCVRYCMSLGIENPELDMQHI